MRLFKIKRLVAVCIKGALKGIDGKMLSVTKYRYQTLTV